MSRITIALVRGQHELAGLYFMLMATIMKIPIQNEDDIPVVTVSRTDPDTQSWLVLFVVSLSSFKQLIKHRKILWSWNAFWLSSASSKNVKIINILHYFPVSAFIHIHCAVNFWKYLYQNVVRPTFTFNFISLWKTENSLPFTLLPPTTFPRLSSRKRLFLIKSSETTNCIWVSLLSAAEKKLKGRTELTFWYTLSESFIKCKQLLFRGVC